MCVSFCWMILLLFILTAKEEVRGTSFLEYPAININKDSSWPISSDTVKRQGYLNTLLKLLPKGNLKNGRVSFLDETFPDWLQRTGELPPDFDKMVSIPFLPNSLILDEGCENIHITTLSQWEKKKRLLKKQIEYYITGTCPPPPTNLKSRVLSEKMDGQTILRMVELTFGPGNQAKMTLELLVPPGKGPFPVFLTQWNHRGWAQIAVSRGYVGCIYAGADIKDDTEKYSEIWAHKFDFTRLMRRAYGASRVIDYLYGLPFIDKKKIGLSGHSRNGKQSLFAAAFDERISAVIPSSGGTGTEVPWRYSSINFDVEDIALLHSNNMSWYHPRMFFFVGRENKLPVDQNSFVDLVAPRGMMLSIADNEGVSNAIGTEQAYFASQKVYSFLGQKNNLALRFRNGLHGTDAGDIEDYIDFFDYIFKRGGNKPKNELLIDYSFEKWLGQSKEYINPLNYPIKAPNKVLTDSKGEIIKSLSGWENKKAVIQKSIRWVLGDGPPRVTNIGPLSLKNGGKGEEYFGTFLERPMATSKMGRMNITPYNEFGNYLYGYIYYPIDKRENIQAGRQKIPMIVYLHEYDYSKGFSSYHIVDSFFQKLVDQGYAVLSYDMMGFGNRLQEGTRFYNRYPRWSKMGKLVDDLQGALDAIYHLDFVDTSRVFVVGYSLGGTVALYTAALDNRISGVVSISGFTPMRSDIPEKGTGGIKVYSHIHGLLPRLGFFVGNEKRIPFDFDEILSSIAPRPLLVISPKFDKDANLQDIQNSVKEGRNVYKLYNASERIKEFSPDDYNRFSNEMQEKVYEWMNDKLK